MQNQSQAYKEGIWNSGFSCNFYIEETSFAVYEDRILSSS